MWAMYLFYSQRSSSVGIYRFTSSAVSLACCDSIRIIFHILLSSWVSGSFLIISLPSTTAIDEVLIWESESLSISIISLCISQSSTIEGLYIASDRSSASFSFACSYISCLKVSRSSDHPRVLLRVFQLSFIPISSSKNPLIDSCREAKNLSLRAFQS